ncbi:MAG: PHP domain-containing protein [Clostridia bacterium]|nr:PHP domain-containing protein [Clostridia bacterium]
MRIYLLPEKGSFYKANLHCHSTISDGKWTPEEIKKNYQAEGYSIVAYTDHDIMIPHPELADENFLPMVGYEIEISQAYYGDAPRETVRRRTCHLCFVGLTPDVKQVCWHREKYLFGNAPDYRDQAIVDESLPNFERLYHPECINEMIRRGVEGGFFVTYNHPVWSLERYPEYMSYHGMHAMEIVNNSCLCGGFNDYNPSVFDDMLLGGKRVFCSATDDNHNAHPENPDSFGGFNMIKAEGLTYESISKALLRGDFYASQGPLIHDLYVEDGHIHIRCSDAAEIALTTDCRRAKRALPSDGKPLCEASFTFHELDHYFRLTVTDVNGKRSHTQAYYPKEILAQIKK